MKIRVLGAHNTVSRSTRLTSLVVDDFLALDAGSLASGLSFRAQMKITDLLITHAHYDHIRDLPGFTMNLSLRGQKVRIHCNPAVRDEVLASLMNGRIYPDFTARPPDKPVVTFRIVEPGLMFDINGYAIKPLPVHHSLPALGYEITAPSGESLFYTGDTGPSLADTWQQTKPRLLIIEVTASNRWGSFVRESLHMTPELLSEELLVFRKIHGYVPHVLAVHINPELENEITSELLPVAAEMGNEITIAHEGMVVRL